MTDRREFLQSLPALVAAARLNSRLMPPAPGPLIGVQMGAHTMLDEGIEPCLDLCRETAAVDTLFTYSHAYGGDVRKPIEWLATDHGKPPIDQRSRKLPQVYVKLHDEYYKDTSLRHQQVDSSFAYFNRDLFAEMRVPATRRGMKIYARILEARHPDIRNFDKVVMVDVNGKPTQTACWNHPEYKAFWNATVTDLFKSYDLDGFQWGAERASPLTRLINGGAENTAACFCRFCLARGKAHGIDTDRARTGFAAMLAYIQALRGGKRPPEGAYAGYFGLLMRYPEILAWDYQYRLSREEIMKGMYDTIKAIKPSAEVGWHVDHWATSMDIIARAAMTYAEMAPWGDYEKIVVYHAVTSPRLRSWIASEQRSILSDMTLEQAIAYHYELWGYPKSLDVIADKPTPPAASPEYVYAETRRSVESAQGKTKIYPGIGFNLPGGGPDDPDAITQCVLKAFDAGAAGIVISREYEELTVPNLRGVGRAVQQVKKT